MSFYGTVAGADAYHTARGNTAWTGSNALKEAALTRASQYVDGRSRRRFPSGRWMSLFVGTKAGERAQELEWPRTGAVDYNGHAVDPLVVPLEVQHATYEAALRELVAPGSLTPDYVASAHTIREKVGPVEVAYASPSDSSYNGLPPNQPVITAVDTLLAPLLRVYGGDPAVRVV
jgi:hypothetical protein